MNKKNTTKKINKKSTYTIDLSMVSNPQDVYTILAFSKIKKHLIDPGIMTQDEFEAMCAEIAGYAIEECSTLIDDFCEIVDKLSNSAKDLINSVTEKKEIKLPWYKRFWNWITRKK